MQPLALALLSTVLAASGPALAAEPTHGVALLGAVERPGAYAVALSGAELNPRFGGGGEPVLVAYARTGPDGVDGPLGVDERPARLVVPGDRAGGRYVNGLASLRVLDAAAVPLTMPPRDQAGRDTLHDTKEDPKS